MHYLIMLNQWLEKIESLHPLAIEMGLDRSRVVLSRLQAANLVPSAPFVVTIGGTNGKGTTLKCIQNAAVHAGLQVGSYTSPHLFVFNERIQINGHQVTDEQIISAFESVERYREQVSLTYYEFTTLAAFVIFAAHSLDLWLLEVGLGGRLDTVNILDAHVAVITSIALDHEAYLGSTREAIAAEKIQIARKARPVFLGGEDIPQAIVQHCQMNDIPLFAMDTRQIIDLPTGQWSLGFSMPHATTQWLPDLPMPKIPRQNAALGIQVWCFIASILDVAPWALQTVQALLEITSLFGRFHQLPPAQTPAEVWIDAAHNPAAAQLLAKNLQSLAPRKTTAIFAMMADKDIVNTIRPLLERIDNWCLLALDNARALPAHQLRQVLLELGVKPEMIECCSTIDIQSVDQAKRFIIFGSFYTLAAVIG